MPLETFLLERYQTLYENSVEINLTESGVEPMTLRQFLTADEREAILDLPLGYGHTDGTPALRRAIAGLFPGATEENVLVTAGTAEANFLAAWTLLGEGRGLAGMIPNYTQLHGLAQAFGAPLTTFSLQPDRNWQLDLAALSRAVTERTAMITVCNPNNPTGKVLSEAEMDAVVGAARQADAWLLADEIYRGSELGERPETQSFWGRYEKTIVTGSVSKALAHSGLRIGWMVAPAELVAETRRHQDYTTIGTTAVGQFVAERVLAPARRRALLDRARAILNRNQVIVDDWVKSHGQRLDWQPPEAGGVAFIRYGDAIPSERLSERLRLEESTFVVAGSWFGLEGHMRIGIGGESDRLAEGLRRIDRLLATL